MRMAMPVHGDYHACRTVLRRRRGRARPIRVASIMLALPDATATPLALPRRRLALPLLYSAALTR